MSNARMQRLVDFQFAEGIDSDEVLVHFDGPGDDDDVCGCVLVPGGGSRRCQTHDAGGDARPE